MDRFRDKMAIPVSGRLTPARFRTLQGWCSGAYRKRSEVVSMVLDRVPARFSQLFVDLGISSLRKRLPHSADVKGQPGFYDTLTA